MQIDILVATTADESHLITCILIVKKIDLDVSEAHKERLRTGLMHRKGRKKIETRETTILQKQQ